MFSEIGTFRMRDVHQQVVAIVKISLSQSNRDWNDRITIQLDFAAASPFVDLDFALLMQDIRDRGRSGKGLSRKATNNRQDSELHNAGIRR
jgi:hypothetical protein